MKTGRTITELAQEIERQSNAKRDFISDTRELELIPPNGDPNFHLRMGGEGGINEAFTPTTHAHRQIGARIGIPAPYYQRMQEEAPELLAHNVNHWFREKPERRMFRTLDHNARAFLSDRYRILDNEEVMEAVLPTLAELDTTNGLQIISTEITERRLYLKALFPRIENEVSVGDPVQSGIIISNSEIGVGSVSVMPLVYRLVCKNGMIRASEGKRKYHTGRAASGEEGAHEFYRDETLEADDRAFVLKLRDIVHAVATQAAFDKIVNRLRESTQQQITGNVEKAVEVAAKRFRMNDTEQSSVLRHLINGGDLSAWGLANAVTRASQDVDDYDRATELERTGGEIIDLAPSEWKVLSEAA